MRNDDTERDPTIAETIARFKAMAANLRPHPPRDKLRKVTLPTTLGPRDGKLELDAFERFRPRRGALKWLDEAPNYVMACYDNGGQNTEYRYTVLFGGDLWDLAYARANWESGRDPRLMPCLMISDGLDYSIWTDCVRGARLGRRMRWLDIPANIREHVMVRAGRR